MPEFIVLNSCHTPGWIESGIHWTDPSQNAAFTPPPCLLRAICCMVENVLAVEHSPID